jgi:hypothetical protein
LTRPETAKLNEDWVETFRDFCAELSNITVSRIRPATELNEETLPSDSILIGCGSKFSKFPPSALVLDNKGAERRFGIEQDIKCVTRLVIHPPRGFFDMWPLWDERPLKPKAFLERVTLVVEDASPDSTWGLLLLLARIAGCDLSKIVPAWLPVIERWEVEGMVDDPWTEWPSLASALAHSQFSGSGEPTSEDYARAWTDTLRFAAGSLVSGLRPRAIKNCEDWDLWRQAYSALKQEEQAYHEWLQHAQIIQLSLPMKESNRRLLVDAIIFVEDLPTGATKAFYRNDRINSPLKEGFTLAADYRPEKQKGDQEITIALDPRKGAHLRDLWDELETRERDAWEKSDKHRPNNHRRDNMDQYLRITNQWNEPWYIDPSKTLVAAPRYINDEGPNDYSGPGSLLSWDEVKDAIWTVYNPLKGVMVCRPADGSRGNLENEHRIQLLHLTPETTHRKAKRLLLADWPRKDLPEGKPPPRSLGNAPVVERVIARLIEDGATQKGGIDSLPEPGTWERVKLDAGFAIVTEKGVFVLDDWHPTHRLDAKKIRDTFQKADDLDHKLKARESDVHRLDRRLKEGLEHKPVWAEFLRRKAQRLPSWLKLPCSKSGWKEPKGLVADAAGVSVKLADLRATTVSVSANSDVRRLAEALDHRWALTSRLNLLEEQTKTIRDSVKELGDAQGRRIIRFVGLYGFPFYVAEGLAEHLADPIAKYWPTLASGDKASPPLWWACFLIVFVISGLFLNLLVGRDTPKLESEKGN